MKRFIGLVLVVLALAGTVNSVLRLGQARSVSSSGNAAYDAGRKAGGYTAVVVCVALGVFGMWLLLQGDSARVCRRSTSGTSFPAGPPPLTGGYCPGDQPEFKPWFKTVPAIVGFSIAGTLVALVVLVGILGWVGRGRGHRATMLPPTSPRTSQAASMPPGQPTQAGLYTVGQRVEARWAGKWIPGQITAINPGGFNVMILLQDSRFPQPIVLSTNQLRPL
jgi:hypothetical protein